MHAWFFLLVATLLVLPAPAFSETWEEFQKLKESDEKTGLIPKGGPRLIPKDIIIEGLKKECQVTFTSDALLFQYGSAKLKDEASPNVQNIAGAINQALNDPELSQIRTYYVDGHTCAVGSDDNNCRLSWMRAQSIIDELAKLGVPRDRLVPRGFGKGYPSHSNDTETTRMMNRRVVLQGDCPTAMSRSANVPCQMKAASEQRRTESASMADSSGSQTDSESFSTTIDTSDHDQTIAELRNSSNAPSVPSPFGIMIPMGKDAREKPALPSGFKRTETQQAPQAAGQGTQTGKSAETAKPREQKGFEGKGRELPQGFRRAE